MLVGCFFSTRHWGQEGVNDIMVWLLAPRNVEVEQRGSPTMCILVTQYDKDNEEVWWEYKQDLWV